MRFVYLSEGKLFLKDGSNAAVELESPFAREHEQRAEQRSARHAWKGADRDPASPYSASVVWGRQAQGGSDDAAPVVQHVARGRQPGEILYVLRMSASSGLFRYDLGAGEERRLFHRQDFNAAGLSCDARSGEIIVAVADREGLANLELIDAQDRRRGALTDGQARDAFPAHDPTQPGAVYFQSAGAGRDAEGHLLAFGPSVISRLDPAAGKLETVIEDDRFDHLGPQLDSAGNLYYIRRPYGRSGHVSLGEQAKAFVLMPYRLLRAGFGFLDAFTRMFAREPLKPAGGPDLRHAQQRHVFLYDSVVRLEHALKKHAAGDENAALVPPSWELIKRTPDGDEHVIATNVAAFTVGPGDELLYTNGFRVWRAGASSPELLHKGQLVQALAIV